MICSDCFTGNALPLAAATLMLSFNSRLSTSFVIHFAPATPTKKAPASAENRRLIPVRALSPRRAKSMAAPDP